MLEPVVGEIGHAATESVNKKTNGEQKKFLIFFLVL